MATTILLQVVFSSSENEGIPVYWLQKGNSPEAGRLASGSLVRELLRADGWLSYSKVSGDGPSFGWINVRSSKPIFAKAEKVWTVAGAEVKSGILVREGLDLKSREYPQRLSAGAMVKELIMRNDRIRYELLTGSGPKTGWISTKIAGKEILVKSYQNAGSQLPKILPRLTRTPKLPGREVLPQHLQKFVKPDRVDRSPQLYLLFIPGASDVYLPLWCERQVQARPDVELATYEWKGHGARTDEPAETFEDLAEDCFDAFREAMTTGPFILAAHSVGTRIMIYVAERAHRELGVTPLAALALDYGPPHLEALSDYAADIMQDPARRDEWMRIFETPMFVKHQAYKQEKAKYPKYNGPGSEDEMDAYLRDRLFLNDVLPVGFHSFPCALYVFIAKKFWSPNKLDNYERSLKSSEGWREERKQYTRTGTGIEFERKEFDTWKEWGPDVRFQYVDCDHMEVMDNGEYLWKLSDVISSFLESRSE